MRKTWAFFLVCVLVPGLAHAQTTRYNTWSDPNAAAQATSDLTRFKEKLNKLIDEAEKARAADPMFLKDLRDLANGVTNPYPNVVLDDAFADGNFTANPAWQVLSGAYFIESGWGLRNRILQKQPETTQSNSGDDLAKVLLGTIIKRAAGVQDSQTPTENVITTRARVSNAFAMEFEVYSAQSGGHFEIGVFQGDTATVGYRLLYVSGKGVQLHRVGSRGSSLLQSSADAITLEDKKFHSVQWTRATDGTLRVAIDGTEVLSVVDRGFSDPFDGLRISDQGGDFIVKRVTVRGS